MTVCTHLLPKVALLSILLQLLFSALPVFAQQVIISDDSTYNQNHAHVLLELYSQSFNKGILIPRIDARQRALIQPTQEEEALLVYDTYTHSFWYWDGNEWQEIASNQYPYLISLISQLQAGMDSTNQYMSAAFEYLKIHERQVASLQEQLDSLSFDGIEDADLDTRIWVEKSPDEDFIRFFVANKELMLLRPDSLILMQADLVLDGDFQLNDGPVITHIQSNMHLGLSDSSLVTEAAIKSYVDSAILENPPPIYNAEPMYIMVNDFGIMGDSTTDHSQAINDLIRDYPNKTLFFADGIYIANLHVEHPITLASFSGNVVIRGLQNGQPVLKVDADCRLIGIQFEHPDPNLGSDGIRNNGYDIIARDCKFIGFEHDATHLNSQSRYDRCTFTITGMSLGTLCWSGTSSFHQCTFNGMLGADVQDSKFYQCYFEGIWGVHMPEGAIDNAGGDSGFDGIAEFHHCELRGSVNYAIGLGNRAHARMYHCNLIGYDAGAYARSESTFEMYNCYIESTRGGGTAAALFFSKYIKADKEAIGLIDSGDSYFSNCTFVNSGSETGLHIVVPNKSDAGKVILSNCDFDPEKICTEDTLGFCIGDIYKYIQFGDGQATAVSQILSLSNQDTLMPPITAARQAYLDVSGDGGPVSGVILHKSHFGTEYPTGYQVFIRCGSSTESVTLKHGYNAGLGVGLFTANGADLELSNNDVVIFTYTKSTWIQSSPITAVFYDNDGDVSLGGSLTMSGGAAVSEFSTDGSLAGNSDEVVPTEQAVKSYVDDLVQLAAHNNIQNDGWLTVQIPAGTRIAALIIEETAGQNTGTIKIGTSPGGDDVCSGISLSANQIADCNLAKKVFSLTSSQPLYLSNTAWNSSQLSIYFRIEKIYP